MQGRGVGCCYLLIYVYRYIRFIYDRLGSYQRFCTPCAWCDVFVFGVWSSLVPCRLCIIPVYLNHEFPWSDKEKMRQPPRTWLITIMLFSTTTTHLSHTQSIRMPHHSSFITHHSFSTTAEGVNFTILISVSIMKVRLPGWWWCCRHVVPTRWSVYDSYPYRYFGSSSSSSAWDCTTAITTTTVSWWYTRSNDRHYM